MRIVWPNRLNVSFVIVIRTVWRIDDELNNNKKVRDSACSAVDAGKDNPLPVVPYQILPYTVLVPTVSVSIQPPPNRIMVAYIIIE